MEEEMGLSQVTGEVEEVCGAMSLDLDAENRSHKVRVFAGCESCDMGGNWEQKAAVESIREP